MGGGSRRSEPSRRIARAVAVGFGALALAFTVAMGAALWLGHGIREAADSIVTNASPSVSELASMRTEIRHLEVVLDDAVERRRVDGPRRDDMRAVAEARGAVANAWRQYLALPVFPTEAAMWPAVEQERARLDVAVDEAMNAPTPAAADAMLARVKTYADGLDAAVLQLRNYNADENAEQAMRIRRHWRQLVIGAVGATALVVLIALATAMALGRVARHLARATEERADELEAFSGRVAHDLVGPLTAAVMTLSLVRDERPEDELLRRRLDRLTSTLRRASTLVRDLYEYAAAGGHPDRQARTDVGEVVRDVVAQLEARVQRDAEIVVDQPLAAAAVACRPGVLVSIMTNLIDNAIKHVGDAERPRIAVHVRAAREAVRIEVEDNGPGITAERASRLFEPYERGDTRAAGLGLGLATVKRLTESHGGAVGVQSTVGHGSTFWLELPRA